MSGKRRKRNRIRQGGWRSVKEVYWVMPERKVSHSHRLCRPCGPCLGVWILFWIEMRNYQRVAVGERQALMCNFKRLFMRQCKIGSRVTSWDAIVASKS
jgi:hypothetical protein